MKPLCIGIYIFFIKIILKKIFIINNKFRLNWYVIVE